MADTTMHDTPLRCPFYGLHNMAGALLAARCNQCALKDSHRPCDMEVSGKEPDWHTCARREGMSTEELDQWRKRKVVGFGTGLQDEMFAARFDRLAQKDTH